MIDHTPLPFAVPVPATAVPSYSVTTLLASAVPVTVGVTILVMRSLALDPLSDPAARASPVGATIVLSMVTVNVVDEVAVLLAVVTATAVRECVPSLSVLEIAHVPFDDAVPLASTVPPSYRVTTLPASAAPVKVGVVTLVMSSPTVPPSDAASRKGPVRELWVRVMLSPEIEKLPGV